MHFRFIFNAFINPRFPIFKVQNGKKPIENYKNPVMLQ